MAIKTTYRRTSGDIFWHFRIACKYWPQKNFDEIKDAQHPPKRGGFCVKCLQLRADERFVYLKNNFPFLVAT